MLVSREETWNMVGVSSGVTKRARACGSSLFYLCFLVPTYWLPQGLSVVVVNGLSTKEVT